MPTATRPHRNRHLKNRPPWERRSPEWRKRNLARACRTVTAAGLLAAGLLTTPAQAQLPHPFDVSKIDGLNGFRLVNQNLRVLSGVGDIDGDGFDDMLMGEYLFGLQCPFISCTSRGVVYWVRGKSERNNIQLDMSHLSLPDGVAHAGAFDNAQAGKVVAGIGDFNGDMLNDILFTARSQFSGSNFNGYVVFGQVGGFPDGFSVDLADGTNGFRIEGTNIKSASSAGDVNGDGFDDIIVGNDDAYNDYGAAWVIFGRNQADIPEILDVREINGEHGFIIHGEQQGSDTARSVGSAGDINGDGYLDVFLTASKFDFQGNIDSGASYVIFGKSTIGDIDLADLSILNNGIRINTLSGSNFFDGGSTIGDFNGDGFSDIGLSESLATINGRERVGRGIILFGYNFNTHPLVLEYLDDTSYLITEGINANDGAGSIHGMGDFNGDGNNDIINQPSLFFSNNNISYLLFGTENLYGVMGLDQIDGTNGGLITGLNVNAPVNCHIGDFNGDGFADFIQHGYNSLTSHIIFGSGTSQQATYKSFARSDDAPISGIGHANKGAQSAPSSRLWVDFTDGSGFGKDNASLQVVTRTLPGHDLSNINHTANVYWFLETDRENYIRESQKGIVAGYVEIMVKYLDGEVWHLDENSLALYSAPSPAGPWTLMDNQVLNTAQNRIKARTTSLLPLYFAITGNPVEQAAIPTPSLLTLTPYTDAWLAPLGPAERFFPPAQIGFTGFRHQFTGWQTLNGDFNGDGVADLATITPWQQWWTALGRTYLGFDPPEKKGVSWRSDPQNGYLVLAGDFNGDGVDTLLQLSPTGVLSSAQPPQLGQNPDGPQFLAVTSLRHNPVGGLHVFVADVNGDGADDLVQIDNIASEIKYLSLRTWKYQGQGSGEKLQDQGAQGENDQSVAALRCGSSSPMRNTEIATLDASHWGSPGFEHDPANGKGIHFGDFNGDGELDVCEIAFPQVRVALGDGATLAAPTVWNSSLYFQDNPNEGDGWYVFATDIDRDGTDDLIQLTDTGEVWTARSNGTDGFLAPTRNAQLGFHHKPDGPWQVFVVE